MTSRKVDIKTIVNRGPLMDRIELLELTVLMSIGNMNQHLMNTGDEEWRDALGYLIKNTRDLRNEFKKGIADSKDNKEQQQKLQELMEEKLKLPEDIIANAIEAERQNKGDSSSESSC